jgi:cell division protein FtsN
VAEKIKPATAIKATPKTTDGASDQTAVGAQKGSFDFYTLLPDSEVKPGQVEAYISTPKDPTKKTNVVLQVGSFRKLADANRLRAKLILINMTNVVAEKTVSSNGAIWFRVRVGPFSNRSTLNKAEDILAQQGIESIRINKTTN